MITMNRFTRTAAVAAVGLSLAIPTAASAADRKAQNALIGGLVGALAGGLIGGDATGAVVGAGAGALLGAATTRDRHDYRGGYERRYAPDYGYRGGYERGYGRQAYDYGRGDSGRGGYGGYGGYETRTAYGPYGYGR